ncbi:ATP binding protein [Tritrichomonas foetus]|uniref:GPN-loop GTPase 3 n=1 Tax=Tritrichomonas foetus TaxID=1144522 RepID=A0A1J4JFV8_9EUKA|nr:ATP binding protein [Tritrichomonas foetus]|eukprot:OHS98008.1 ATP binding protein [Tritrichomonas foetus]
MSLNRFAQIVMGPAGSGKSTYIRRLLEHFEVTKRVVHAVNLDPAADNLCYQATIDIREALNVQEYMNEYGYGPNGALIHCMETVVDDYEWFDKAIGDHDGDYLLIDLPGQIELFSHLNILPRLFSNLEQKGYHMCSVFLLDSQFMCDPSKFLSGCLVAISCMTMMEMPHINLLSKCDLLTEDQKNSLDEFCDMDLAVLGGSISRKTEKVGKLTSKICELVQEFNLVEFQPFDPTDPESVIQTVSEIDILLNYYEDADFMDEEVDMNDGDQTGDN